MINRLLNFLIKQTSENLHKVRFIFLKDNIIIETLNILFDDCNAHQPSGSNAQHPSVNNNNSQLAVLQGPRQLSGNILRPRNPCNAPSVRPST